MKCVLLFSVFFLISAGGKNRQDGKSESMIVKVQQAYVFSKANFFSTKLFPVTEGTVLNVLGKSGLFIKVDHQRRVGFIHSSAVTERKKYIPSHEVQSQGVTDFDETMAAKGFNPTAEGEFRRNNNLDKQFEMLDRIIIGGYPHNKDMSNLIDRVIKFRQEGGLDR